MLSSLGDPHAGMSCIHVAGTNGKGSTAALAESALRRGHRTGLYTSPHLCDFAERIRIDGTEAEPALLEDCATRVLPLAEQQDASFFEAATVLAFEAFRAAGCEVVIAEVGLGGRLDATNVVDPAVSVIASIAMDHSDYLGDTLEQIAAEKAGILKPGVPAVVGRLADAPLAVIAARSIQLDIPIDVLGRDFFAGSVDVSLGGTSLSYRSAGRADGVHVHTPLVGEHQADNAALAIRALERFDPDLDPEDLVQGFATVTWPGRFEVLEGPDGTWVLDIAHNPAAVEHLAELLESLPVPRPIVLLLSVLGDKAWPEMLDRLLGISAAAVFTIAPSSPMERRWDPVEALRTCSTGSGTVVVDFEKALPRARELAGQGTVVVTGSAHTVGDARALISNDTYKE
jgi:dihydrofolate synthase/folylpolyglutamate synthase